MQRKIVFGLFVGMAAILTIGTAEAQSVPVPQDERGIVVTGQREIPPEVARRFVSDISTTVEGQFARFHDPVCPIVIGLPDQYSVVVADRIRAVAEEAGAQIPSKQKCAPNLIVIVADNADQLVKQMRKKIPGIFAGLRTGELRRAMRDGPVHVWNTVETQNEDGRTSTTSGLDTGSRGAPTMQVRSVSLINASTQQAVVQSVVVLDDDALIDKSLNQIAEYVAMRTLAGARPPSQPAGADTILALFDAGAVAPPGMTSVDRSYLEGLYRTRPLGRAIEQKSVIARQITRDAKKRSGAD